MNPLDANNNKSLTVSQHPPSVYDGNLVRPGLAMTGPVPTLGPEAMGKKEATGPSLEGLLHALRRRWVLAFSLATLAAMAAVALVFLAVPARYTAQAAVQVHSRGERSLLSAGLDGEDPEFVILKANQAAMVKSPEVLLAALSRIQVPWSVKDLEMAIKTDFLLGPEILRLTLAGDDKEEITKLLNGVVEALVEKNQQKDHERRRMKLDLLEINRQKTENVLRQKKITLLKEMRKNGLNDLETLKANYQLAQQNVTLFRKEVLQAHLDLVSAQQELKSLQEQEKNLPGQQVPDFLIDRELEKMPQGKIYFDKLSLVITEIQHIKTTAVNPEPLLQHRLAERESLIKEMANLRNLVRPDLESKLRAESLERVHLEVNKAQDKINSLGKRKEILVEEVKKAEEEVKQQNPAQRDLSPVVEALRDEVNRLEGALNKLGEAIEVLKVEPIHNSRISIWQPAVEPKAKDLSRQIKFAGAGALGAFCLALFGVSFWEFRSRRISAAAEVAQQLGLHVVGTLPAIPVRFRRGQGDKEKTTPGLSAWQNQLSEAVDSIRSLLLHSGRTENLHVIMISSPLSKEGKTSLASQLAASLARAWRKTLLIDGDLRNPGAHKLFGLPVEPGFCEVLRGEMDVTAAIKPTSMSRLWLLPGGQWDSHAGQALAQESVRTLFETLKQQYDFIIMDSSPVLAVADALSLGQHVDGVIFSVLRDVSRVPALQAAQQRLTGLGIRVLGAVMIGTKNEIVSPEYQYGMTQG